MFDFLIIILFYSSHSISKFAAHLWAVLLTQPTTGQRSHWHTRHGSAVSLTLPTIGQRCQWHCGVYCTKFEYCSQCHWHWPAKASRAIDIRSVDPDLFNLAQIWHHGGWYHQWCAVSLTLPTTGQQCHCHSPQVFRDVIDTANRKNPIFSRIFLQNGYNPGMRGSDIVVIKKTRVGMHSLKIISEIQ
jgi:hypothetical protein